VPISGQPDMPGYWTVTDALMYADSATWWRPTRRFQWGSQMSPFTMSRYLLFDSIDWRMLRAFGRFS
jgi:hypothetical protein